MIRYRNKWYFKIPYGEVQYGVVTRSLRIWFKGKLYTLNKGKWNTKRYRRIAKDLYK